VVGRRVKHACRLDWYWDRCSITDRQHAAGLRFRRDWHIATAGATLVGTYGLRVRGYSEFREAQLMARRRVKEASRRLGASAVAVAIDVCCFDNWASGRLPVLRDGLSALADLYGLPR
jgi:Domain of unknown function (DUF6456)